MMTEIASPYTVSHTGPRAAAIVQADDSARYLSIIERIIFEHLGGIDMLFGREQVLRIVIALVKKYPVPGK